jgi:hypothetical protein
MKCCKSVFLNADLDLTFHLDADADLDPDSTTNRHKLEKLECFKIVFTAVPVYFALSFLSASKVSKFSKYFGQFIENFLENAIV